MSCDATATGTASVSWINYANEVNGDLTITGTVPSTASNIAVYNFTCKATDKFGAEGTEYLFSLTIVDNVDITVVQ